MNPPSTKGSILRNLTVAGVLLFAVLGFAWRKSAIHSETLVCRVCSAESSEKTMFIHKHIIGRWHTEPQPSFFTTNYFAPYLAYPHSHEWLPKNSDPTVMRGRPLPTVFQMEHTWNAYQLVAASGIASPEDRRRYFESIIRPQDTKHHIRVWNTHSKISRQIRRDPSENSDTDPIWGPHMEGVVIPDEVKAGGLLPDDN